MFFQIVRICDCPSCFLQCVMEVIIDPLFGRAVRSLQAGWFPMFGKTWAILSEFLGWPGCEAKIRHQLVAIGNYTTLYPPVIQHSY